MFRHPYKTDAGYAQLVGTDPAEEDRNKTYLWPDVIGGWEDRRPCTLPQEGLQRLHNNSGKTSNWPGSIPMAQEKRPVGRPPKPPTEKAEREVVRVPLDRAIVLKAMRCAAAEEKLLPQWIRGLVEAELAKHPVATDHVAAAHAVDHVADRGADQAADQVVANHVAKHAVADHVSASSAARDGTVTS